MDRLTVIAQSGLIHPIDNTEHGYNLCIKKLSDFEDLEDDGRLIKLPCKIGDKVYYARKCLAPSCSECGGFRRVNNCYCDYKGRIFEQEFDLRHLYAFGKSVFLTQEEAIQALKENK